MRYTFIATFTPTAQIQVSLGGHVALLQPGVLRTADQILGAINAAMAGHLVLSRTEAGHVALAWASGETGPLVLGSALAAYLGFAGGAVPVSVVESPAEMYGFYSAEMSEPWGGREKQTYRDTANPYGRMTAAETAVESSGGCVLWVHKRGDAEGLVERLASLYEVADAWVRCPVEIINQYGAGQLHTVAAGWECAPQLLDSETATLALETIRWA